MATIDYLELAKEAFEASSAYIDSNWKADWEYSLRAFRNEHAAGSKYLSDDYKSRSRLFRPKTRTIIRKNEAAGAVALFSNMEVVNLQPGNPDDVMSVASAAAMKEILEYRLTKTIPSFQVCLGGLQDAQVTGTVCSYQYWEYERRADGSKVKDQPCIELRPIENIRLDGGASWLDPVGTTPYFCDIIPMYVCDVRAMMKNVDDKTGKPKWKTFDDTIILKAKPDQIDSTRQARLGKVQDPHQEETGIKSFDVVWVMRWFMRDSQGEDQTFYTLGTEELLTEARPLADVYFHGKRPYVIGYAVLETHKTLKNGLPMLTRPLQQETNDVANQRLDNVKFVLNKRWLVARGRQVDVQSLVRNVPGGVTLVTDPKNDVQESNWPDVTSSAYVEHDRLNSEFDDLAGNFSPSTKVANNAVNDTLGGSRMASQGAGMMSDYLLRTVIETWWEPVLRQLILLEQHYETDEIILGVCANKAQLFQKFGISQITDMMLMNEINVTVNVGMGSSNPKERQQNFLAATSAAIQLVGTAPPGANVQEMIKEIYSNAGYRDGSRFFSEQQDPRLIKAMQMIQQLQGQLNGKQMEIQAQGQIEQMKLLSAEKIKGAQLQVDSGRIQGDLQIRSAELVVEQQKLELAKLQLQADMQGSNLERQARMTELSLKIEEAQTKLEHERMKMNALAVKTAADIAQDQRELVATESNENRVGQVADSVAQSMQVVADEIVRIKEGLSSTHEALMDMSGVKDKVEMLNIGLGAVAGMMNTPKRKAKGFTLKKDANKQTNAVMVDYDDGSTDEMPVNRMLQ